MYSNFLLAVFVCAWSFSTTIETTTTSSVPPTTGTVTASNVPPTIGTITASSVPPTTGTSTASSVKSTTGTTTASSVPSTPINQSVCIGKRANSFIAMNANKTWFEALEHCKTFPGNFLDLPYINWPRTFAYNDYLQETNYSLPAVFWTGFFRPHPDVSAWYLTDSTTECAETDRVDLTDTARDQQCVAMRFLDYFTKPEFVAERCDQRLSYVCFHEGDYFTFETFSGYSVMSLSSGLRDVHVAVEADRCSFECHHSGTCAGFSVDYTNNTCTHQTFQTGHAKGTVTLEYTQSSIIQKVKAGCFNFTMDHVENDVVSDVTYDFPICSIIEVPEGYCPCENATEDEIENQVTREEFENIIVNMTVDAKATSKYRRTLTSAQDDRTSSTGMGTMGVVIIVTVPALLVVFDITNIKQRIRPTT